MDYDKAAAHWIEADKNSVKMERSELKERIDSFIGNHNTCAMAVADGDFVRCTPIEYNYYKNCFWFFSEGGLKFRALKNNKHVCLAIYNDYSGFGKVAGMQVTGIAEMIEPWSDTYTEIVKHKGLPVEAMKKMPEPMNLIRVTPQVIDYLNSAFKADGCGSRQQYIAEED